MERIDIHPTHTYGEFKMRAGRPLPFGATRVKGALIFPYPPVMPAPALVLFKKAPAGTDGEIPFPTSSDRKRLCHGGVRTRLREH